MIFANTAYRRFVVIFLISYALLNYGTEAWIGVCAKGGLYWPWAALYLNYVDWIKHSLLHGVQFFVENIWHHPTRMEPSFLIRIVDKRGVYIAMGCVGYGVYSVWIAFLVAMPQRLLQKLLWMVGGLFVLWLINVLRISMFLVAINTNKTMPLGIDHHTWFNIVAYLMILIFMYLYHLSLKTESSTGKPN
jgi:exosortase/archaeosortase family protein